MSGTSLDGLDIACCHFSRTTEGWSYSLEKTTVLKYPAAWAQKLSHAPHCSAEELLALDVAYGKFLGKACLDFIRQHSLEVDFIASHGHTVFHQPQAGFTCQLGNGNALHAITGIPVIFDFRALDVALGGQGAPLVPAGDQFLFHDYDVCLNLGGIANLSTARNQKRIAYDICFCNMGLNYLMATIGKAFDMQGKLAASGHVHKAMLGQLQKAYAPLRNKRPSLGREIFEKRIKPILDQKKISLEDKLRTCVESTAQEIARAMTTTDHPVSVLCTGGGVLNIFLMTRLLEHCADNATLILPEDDVVKFKEALVFAFLGVLRVTREINCLQSVTGASRDSSAGVMVGF